MKVWHVCIKDYRVIWVGLRKMPRITRLISRKTIVPGGK